MTPQKRVKSSKGRKKGADGGRKKKNPSASDAHFGGPTSILKLRLRPHGVEEVAPNPDGGIDEGNEEVVEHLAATTTRSGRAVKKNHHDDFVYSDDYNGQLASSPPRKPGDNGGTFDRQYGGSTSTPAIYNFGTQLQPAVPSRRSTKRADRNAFQPALDAVIEVGEVLPSSRPTNYEPPREVQTTTINIVEMLTQTPKIHIDLPILSYSSGSEQPYSAPLLMHLYISAYGNKQYDICDLVSDTWIRAFHALRRREEHSGRVRRAMTWRFNDPLTRMREQGIKGYEPNAPSYAHLLVTQDPELEPDVTNPSAHLLNGLFAHTSSDCGARLLWADAMALCGDKIESRMRVAKKKGEKWNQDLKDEVMCTALRLAGKKLTLKIEEAKEGAWCKRYHEHWRRGERCYRKRAYERKLEGLDLDDVESVSEEYEVEMEGVVGSGEGNRVRFEVQPEMIDGDVDAEGETDDE
ncbi:hypothetical protein DE146DRAFT_734277 [Phaeosphaeria sp. MPI-PUGE-AT-0046c]|nr:hypothetical protein DE146DRAFT_734277 [Phaeosphaeria sp. MPI-PUGE-AT-0046c]